MKDRLCTWNPCDKVVIYVWHNCRNGKNAGGGWGFGKILNKFFLFAPAIVIYHIDWMNSCIICSTKFMDEVLNY